MGPEFELATGCRRRVQHYNAHLLAQEGDAQWLVEAARHSQGRWRVNRRGRTTFASMEGRVVRGLLLFPILALSLHSNIAEQCPLLA